MPNYQKQRGDRFERQMVDRLREIGIDASRVPLSGALGGDYSGDIKVKDFPRLKTIECKIRDSQKGYKQVVDWLGNNEMLFLGIDYDEPLAVMPWRVLKGMLEDGSHLRATVERASIPESNTIDGYGDGI